MAYSDFTLSDLVGRFKLQLDEQHDLFSPVTEIQPSPTLHATLAENVALALAISTEKARSEFIIAPILLEVRRLSDRRISLFSGVDFTIDAALGLNGVCDFIISQSNEQLLIRAPVVVIIEAKNENFKAGYAQCAAAMLAAQIFNNREGTGIATIYGAVTIGNLWRFLKLESSTLFVDRVEYHIDRIEAILGILLSMADTQLVPA